MWKDLCEQEWEIADHLNRVANIRNDQIVTKKMLEFL